MGPLLIAAAVVGLLLVVVGVRGRRVDDHPICRRCGFDLIATIGAAGKCPECGAELGGARAVRIGHRRKRRWHIAAGAVLLLVSGLMMGIAAAGTKFNINKYLPTTLLMLESRGGAAASAAGAVGELKSRLGNGALRDGDAKVLVERGLKLQGDKNGPWASEWGEFLEAAWGKGLLTAKQKAEFTRNVVTYRFVMRDPAREGQKCGVSLEVSLSRSGSAIRFDITPSLKTMRIGETVFQGDPMSSMIGMIGSGGTGTVSDEIDLKVAPGDYQVESVWGVSVTTPGQQETLAEWEATEHGKLKVLPAGAELVTRIKDESLRPAMEKAIKITRATLSGSGDQRRFTAAIQITNPPAPMAFDVYVRDASGREWKVGVVTVQAAPRTSHSTSFAGDVPGLASGPVDVVLRPSEDAAMRTVFLKEMWDGEIVVKGVAVGGQGK